jgi:restriction alleviation protein Lar
MTDAPETVGLLACPFCGGPATTHLMESGRHDVYWIGCNDDKCNAVGGAEISCCVYHRDEAKAIAAWNTRAALAPQVTPAAGDVKCPDCKDGLRGRKQGERFICQTCDGNGKFADRRAATLPAGDVPTDPDADLPTAADVRGILEPMDWNAPPTDELRKAYAFYQAHRGDVPTDAVPKGEIAGLPDDPRFGCGMGIGEASDTDTAPTLQAALALPLRAAPALTVAEDAKDREIGNLRTAFRVNMMRLGITDEDINLVLDACRNDAIAATAINLLRSRSAAPARGPGEDA